jgi:hypothetical protein
MVALLLVINAAFIFAEQKKSQDDNDVIFQWTFGAIKNTNIGPQFQTVSRDTTLKTGDQIKFFIKLNKSCYLYLIYQSSQEELSILFPYRFKLLAKDYQISGNHYIPKGDQWFELDEYTGLEKFYLLASAKRLFELEALINEYESADKTKKLTLGQKIIAQIRSLRKKHLKFKTYAEKPVTVIGTMRGTDKTKAVGLKDLADYAVEISASNFFSRTYTIDHQ